MVQTYNTELGVMRAHTRFIAIDGHGGSGKSTLAAMLAERLDAQVIHIDDFTGPDSTDDWYKRIIQDVIRPIINGEPRLSYPRAKWWPEHDPEPVVDQPVTSVMIIEGVGAIRVELRQYMNLKLFVDTPRGICIDRGLARDRGMGDKTEEEIIGLWNQWLDWDEEYFARDDPLAAADIVVDGTKPYHEQLSKMLELIRTSVKPERQ